MTSNTAFLLLRFFIFLYIIPMCIFTEDITLYFSIRQMGVSVLMLSEARGKAKSLFFMLDKAGRGCLR